ncbi:MAG: hypothetical protein QOK42_794 [Frankiaceae bacterium]|nr:hypothetical protein [Frankiaceae bacterium]
MREVRLVGMADDGEHVLLTGPEMGTVALRIDDRLKAAVLRDRRLLDQLQVKSTSSLSVREMQARLRAGATPEEIAADAGVTVEAVRRFAGPVLDERNHVTEEVRRLRTRVGRSLGEAVDPDTTWDAARRTDGTWTVTAAGAAGVALFSWDPAKRHLAPESELAVIALSDPAEVTVPDLAPAPVALSLVREAASATSTGQASQPELAIESEPEPELAVELDGENEPEPVTAAPRAELKTGSTDKQAEADGVAPGKRATVPSWDDILFGTRPPE